MYFPEYSLSNSILKNVANIAYAKAVVENTTILENWQNQLNKKALVQNIQSLLLIEGYNFPEDLIKKRVDLLTDKTHLEIENYYKALNGMQNYIKPELTVDYIKEVHEMVSQKTTNQAGILRSSPEETKTPPEEIIAKLHELVDWLYSKDANDTQGDITALIFLNEFLKIKPFKKFSTSVGLLLFLNIINPKNSNFFKYLKIFGYFYQATKNQTLEEKINQPDLTEWLEMGTEFLASESFSLKDEVLLLSKDTKIAKSSGFVKLTDRQKRVVEYLQDYGILKNKDFATIFPDISEDSVLRDLKHLISQGIVVKTGSTKSSCYVLK